jgi:hypothetical protein
MMKNTRIFILLLVLAASASVSAQTRKDVKIYIPPVKADAGQSSYFQENFSMETRGAGYSLTETPDEADYSLMLEVKPNMVLYDDGAIELAPPDEKQSVLQIDLVRNEDDANMVSFSFLFNDVDEMNDFNLYLLYEAMANIPFTKAHDIAAANEGDLWRNKWLYIRASFDYPITFYELLKPKWLADSSVNPPKFIPLDHKIKPFPALTFGLELQYLYWMSTEVDIHIGFSDPVSNSLIPVITLEQKFPIKPANIFMLEPYLAVSFPMGTSSYVTQFPKAGMGGGFQFSVKGGNMGAFFLDINFIYYLGDVIMKSPYPGYSPNDIHYRRYTVGLGIGYKIGFFDRGEKK